MHTALSRDAFNSDVRGTPDQAYRFARGESIGIPPLDEAGNPLQQVRLERPLDFAAVTDHAEGMGTIELCTNPDNPSFDSKPCRQFRMLPAHKTCLHVIYDI